MSLFAISDLHLPLGIDKPMDIFGRRWENYVKRLEENWQKTVQKEDTVILAGDFSWATYLEQSKKDFEFLCRLNGEKILLKGNHDYWWSTGNKMLQFLNTNGFSGIKFMQNNSFEYKDISICGSRGWALPSENSDGEDKKIYDREVIRLELSLKSAKNPGNIVAVTHYPPVTADIKVTPVSKLLKKYGVRECLFGHIHNTNTKNFYEGELEGINYRLISADYREFMPVKIAD